MSATVSLQSRLAAALPLGLEVCAYHVSTPAASSPALFAARSGHDEETTSCESHFLAVSSPRRDGEDEVLIYAIEVLVFTSKSLTTLFVSKADSTGLASRRGRPRGSASLVAIVNSTFVDFLLEPRLINPRVVVSLFARSQNQYLFPGSSENPCKHILDDQQLIRWWCRLFDKALRLPRSDTTAIAHLLVPGCDKAETRAFFPSSSRADDPAEPKWANSYPVDLLVTDSSLPPRHLVPRLPDDPKARFLEDLDDGPVDEHGNWRSVKDLRQFWEFLSYRQECSAGRLVGFLWLVFTQEQRAHTNGAVHHSAPASLQTPGNSQQVEDGSTELGMQDRLTLEMLPGPSSPPPSSPLQEEPESKATSSRAEQVSDLPVIEETQGEIVLAAGQYEALMDHLLQTDFAGKEVAAASSKSWVDKTLELANATTFGRAVQGCASVVLPPSQPDPDAASPQINTIIGVRKKRKADVIEDGASRTPIGDTTAVAAVLTLPAGLVRKKPRS